MVTALDPPYPKTPCLHSNLNGAIFYRTWIMGDRSLHCGNRNFRPFCSCALDLNPMTFIYEFGNMNFLRPGFRKLSSDRHTDSQTSYAWSLLVTWQRWRWHHSIRFSWKPRATCKPNDPIFYRAMDDRSLHCENRNFRRFGSRNLDLDLHIWTWPVLPGDIPALQIWTSYVKAFESYRLTDRQTDKIDRNNYKPRRFADGQPFTANIPLNLLQNVGLTAILMATL